MTFVPQILCIAAFYKQKPTVDTPYRRLFFEQNETGTGWQVRLLGGMKWGHENETLLEKFTAVGFAEAEEIYGKKFRELHEPGWTAYSPYISWGHVEYARGSRLRNQNARLAARGSS